MKRTVLIALLVIFASSGTALLSIVLPGPGTWTMVAQTTDCGAGRVCAEFRAPGDAMDGAVCCIQSVNITSTAWVCEELLRGPRPDGDPNHNE